MLFFLFLFDGFIIHKIFGVVKANIIQIYIKWNSFKYDKKAYVNYTKGFKDMKSGIYKITHIPDGKIYIGRSVNLHARLWKHKAFFTP